MPTNNVNRVKNKPIPMFSHFVALGVSIKERNIIKAGTVRIKAAVNNFTGVFSMFCPLKSPSTFPGPYSSK